MLTGGGCFCGVRGFPFQQKLWGNVSNIVTHRGVFEGLEFGGQAAGDEVRPDHCAPCTGMPLMMRARVALQGGGPRLASVFQTRKRKNKLQHVLEARSHALRALKVQRATAERMRKGGKQLARIHSFMLDVRGGERMRVGSIA